MRIVGMLIVLAVSCAGDDALATRIQEAIQRSPEARGGFWGVRIADAATGNMLYGYNEDKFFVPASNTKLFTTSLALERLGPDYRFYTTVHADAVPDAEGVVRELRLIGGGDPNLSARVLPYQRSVVGPNPLVQIEAMADAIVAKGVRVVTGDIVGDDTAYAWDPYPNGWAVDDPVWEYGAPVSALTLNDNAFTMYVQPGLIAGDPATITMKPALEWFTVHNRTTTAESGPTKLTFERLPGKRELIVGGSVLVRAPGRSILLAVDDPALFAASALHDALLERGVRVGGTVRAVHRRIGEEATQSLGVELVRHTSAPLAHVLKVVNKVSQNLHTEIVLREIARVKNGVGTREGGIAEIESFLREIGVEDNQYRFEDASGLSRLTLVTPLTISKLLVHMYGTPHRDTFIELLPVGGLDGTLSYRFETARAEAVNIRAKTGSISHVSSLSGYALRKDGRTLAFSILTNNFNSDQAPVRKVIDAIALALLD